MQDMVSCGKLLGSRMLTSNTTNVILFGNLSLCEWTLKGQSHEKWAILYTLVYRPHNSRKNEEMELKQKQHPVVDVAGDGSGCGWRWKWMWLAMEVDVAGDGSGCGW